MPGSTADDVTYPVASDAFDPAGDMQALAESLRGSLIVPVANTAGRTAKVATTTPTAADPLFVFRADAEAGREIEYTTDGTTWRVVDTRSETTNVITTSHFSNNMVIKRQGRTVDLSGRLNKVTSATTVGATVTIAAAGAIPVDLRPTTTWERGEGAMLFNSGTGTAVYRHWVLRANSDGSVTTQITTDSLTMADGGVLEVKIVWLI